MRTMIFRPLAKLVTRTNVPIRRATFDEQPSTCQEIKLRRWLPDRRLPGISMLYYFYYFLLPAIAALPATRNRAMVNIHLIICRVPDHDPIRQHFNLVIGSAVAPNEARKEFGFYCQRRSRFVLK
jgi:hypothetical protein